MTDVAPYAPTVTRLDGEHFVADGEANLSLYQVTCLFVNVRVRRQRATRLHSELGKERLITEHERLELNARKDRLIAIWIGFVEHDRSFRETSSI